MTIPLETDRSTAKAGKPIALDYRLPWLLGQDGFVKLFAEGASLRRTERGVELIGTRPGEIGVAIFAVEPGREVYAGKLELRVT